MCGFVGIWDSYKSEEKKQRETLISMISPLSHRGPDDVGFWSQDSASFGLAHRRLSIQDLSESGHQPMISSSGRYVIVFNGEIYNHLKLREELENLNQFKISWRGRSDTETLLTAIEFWDIEYVLEKVIGMFAFALWDRKERQIILVRDRFGEKPLYYGYIKNDQNLDQFVFCSELSALKSISNNFLEISPLALSSFFQYGCIPAPLSIYSGIKKLQPGNLLKINCDNESGFAPKVIPKERNWYNTILVAKESFALQSNNLELKEALVKLEDVLIDSINQQTISDVPLGTFLSGGIDSSLITALLQSQKKEPVPSFTISFPDDIYGKNQFFNESPYAQSVASYLGTRHTEIALTYEDAQSLVPDISKFFSEPFADSSQVPTYLVCSEAKKAGLSVMLSGDGGDELFGGYNRHRFGPLIYKRLSKLPFALKNFISNSINFLPLEKKGLNQDKKQKLSHAIMNSQDLRSIYSSFVSIYSGNSQPLNDKWRSDSSSFLKNDCIESISFAEQLMLSDVLNYLPSDILTKVDRAAMNVSLETRAPFLDHRIAEIAWSLPLKFKIKKKGFRYQTKWALKEILKKYVPKDIIDRPKSGFTMPIGQWLKGPLRGWAEDLMDPELILRQGYLDNEKVNMIWQQHLDGSYDNTSKIWTILMWQSWLNEWRK